jgi:hypothetical protein
VACSGCPNGWIDTSVQVPASWSAVNVVEPLTPDGAVGAEVDWAHPIASDAIKRRLTNLLELLMLTRLCNRLATPVRGPLCVL